MKAMTPTLMQLAVAEAYDISIGEVFHLWETQTYRDLAGQSHRLFNPTYERILEGHPLIGPIYERLLAEAKRR
jgi:hypothetical protein